MHRPAIYASFLIIAAVLGEIVAQASIARISRCSKEDHHKCIALADPLLKDPHLIFPDNMKDIDMVCRTWSSFVDCIKRYIDGCFSKQRQEQFNSAVEIPIASVHQMCSVSTYQAEYLQYASCLKATVIDAEHCGNQYAALVDEVSKGEMARTSLCCSHYHFRSCVILETKKKCDGSQSGGAAARFSRQVLDKALSFLHDQCQNYIPNNGDCPIVVTDSSLPLAVSPLDDSSVSKPESKGRPYSRTASTDNYAGQASTFYGTSTNTAHPSSFRNTGRALVMFPTEVTENDNLDNKAAPTGLSTDIGNHRSSTPQEPTPVSKIQNETEGYVEVEQTRNTSPEPPEEPAVVVTQRPANYGRGMSWTPSTAKPSTEIPAWATSTWLTSNQMPVTGEAWYPAAGSFGGNNIDEPNQQGLSNENGQSRSRSELLYLVVLSIVFYMF